jgi:hypothetical protein
VTDGVLFFIEECGWAAGSVQCAVEIRRLLAIGTILVSQHSSNDNNHPPFKRLLILTSQQEEINITTIIIASIILIILVPQTIPHTS